jgi:hypothetical protein
MYYILVFKRTRAVPSESKSQYLSRDFDAMEPLRKTSVLVLGLRKEASEQLFVSPKRTSPTHLPSPNRIRTLAPSTTHLHPSSPPRLTTNPFSDADKKIFGSTIGSSIGDVEEGNGGGNSEAIKLNTRFSIRGLTSARFRGVNAFGRWYISEN